MIVLEDGMISERGSYNELIQKDGSFATFLATYLNELEEDADELLPEGTSLPSKQCIANMFYHYSPLKMMCLIAYSCPNIRIIM